MRPGEWSFLDSMWRWGGFAADAGWAQAAGRVAIERLREERLSRLLGWTRRHSRYYAGHWGRQAPWLILHLPAQVGSMPFRVERDSLI